MRLIVYIYCLIDNNDFVHIYCSEKDKLKDLLIDSYCRLGKAQATVLEAREGEEEDSEGLPTVTADDIKETYQTLQQWVDLNDAKVGGWATRTINYCKSGCLRGVEIYTSYAVRLKPRKIPCTYGIKLKI